MRGCAKLMIVTSDLTEKQARDIAESSPLIKGFCKEMVNASLSQCLLMCLAHIFDPLGEWNWVLWYKFAKERDLLYMDQFNAHSVRSMELIIKEMTGRTVTCDYYAPPDTPTEGVCGEIICYYKELGNGSRYYHCGCPEWDCVQSSSSSSLTVRDKFIFRA